uniref:Uncharacterized protein n=1 Tax=Chromera velia CCMP2878 TaxID=1169474 RepID=A0A0G4FXP3_9ALVE|eukprot:Cvel_19295.t1-p1 / transcript=Cvel_19295.t1 / gene=Cvel_19295 / organism=Chromera_velia_CCMP2878 / gene_product=hypothetical protein / transcript_product=hypothetical protein / location=Cvel_scaffold1652:22285-28726(+) / protein_length=1328 / sequence_SO=supercontig / SO=protein_coding / is_pseudo=false
MPLVSQPSQSSHLPPHSLMQTESQDRSYFISPPVPSRLPSGVEDAEIRSMRMKGIDRYPSMTSDIQPMHKMQRLPSQRSRDNHLLPGESLFLNTPQGHFGPVPVPGPLYSSGGMARLHSGSERAAMSSSAGGPLQHQQPHPLWMPHGSGGHAMGMSHGEMGGGMSASNGPVSLLHLNSQQSRGAMGVGGSAASSMNGVGQVKTEEQGGAPGGTRESRVFRQRPVVRLTAEEQAQAEEIGGGDRSLLRTSINTLFPSKEAAGDAPFHYAHQRIPVHSELSLSVHSAHQQLLIDSAGIQGGGGMEDGEGEVDGREGAMTDRSEGVLPYGASAMSIASGLPSAAAVQASASASGGGVVSPPMGVEADGDGAGLAGSEAGSTMSLPAGWSERDQQEIQAHFDATLPTLPKPVATRKLKVKREALQSGPRNPYAAADSLAPGSDPNIFAAFNLGISGGQGEMKGEEDEGDDAMMEPPLPFAEGDENGMPLQQQPNPVIVKTEPWDGCAVASESGTGSAAAAASVSSYLSSYKAGGAQNGAAAVPFGPGSDAGGGEGSSSSIGPGGANGNGIRLFLNVPPGSQPPGVKVEPGDTGGMGGTETEADPMDEFQPSMGAEMMGDLSQVPKNIQIPEWSPDISFSLGEAGRELLRNYVRNSGSGMRGRVLQNTSIPDLLKLAQQSGLWPVAVRLHLEHKGILPMSPPHAEMRQYKSVQNKKRRDRAAELAARGPQVIRSVSGTRRTIVYRDGMSLKLGGEGRRQLLKALRDFHDYHKDQMEKCLTLNNMKYGELRNATLPLLLRMAYVCGLWGVAVDLHFDYVERTGAKPEGGEGADGEGGAEGGRRGSAASSAFRSAKREDVKGEQQGNSAPVYGSVGAPSGLAPEHLPTIHEILRRQRGDIAPQQQSMQAAASSSSSSSSAAAPPAPPTIPEHTPFGIPIAPTSPALSAPPASRSTLFAPAPSAFGPQQHQQQQGADPQQIPVHAYRPPGSSASAVPGAAASSFFSATAAPVSKSKLESLWKPQRQPAGSSSQQRAQSAQADRRGQPLYVLDPHQQQFIVQQPHAAAASSVPVGSPQRAPGGVGIFPFTAGPSASASHPQQQQGEQGGGVSPGGMPLGLSRDDSQMRSTDRTSTVQPLGPLQPIMSGQSLTGFGMSRNGISTDSRMLSIGAGGGAPPLSRLPSGSSQVGAPLRGPSSDSFMGVHGVSGPGGFLPVPRIESRTTSGPFPLGQQFSYGGNSDVMMRGNSGAMLSMDRGGDGLGMGLGLGLGGYHQQNSVGSAGGLQWLHSGGAGPMQLSSLDRSGSQQRGGGTGERAGAEGDETMVAPPALTRTVARV